MYLRTIIYFVAGIYLAACTTPAPRYNNTADNNLTINLDMDIKGGIFSSVDVVAGINDFDIKCQPHYRGHVELKPGKNMLGIKPGQLTYIQVEVARNNPTTRSSFSRGTLLKPGTGKKYAIDVTYKDNMFDFRLFDVTGPTRKKLNIAPHTACNA